jgi:MraZ protein
MGQFIGNSTNRIDSKGRVSVPPSFRPNLRKSDSDPADFVLRPSELHPCIEGWPKATIAAMAKPPAEIDPFDEAAEDEAVLWYGTAVEPSMDKEGRISLPKDMAEKAGITDEVMFIGAGLRFQIWAPAAGAARLAEVTERRRARSRAAQAGGAT